MTTPTSDDVIRYLARRAVRAGLRYRESQVLFVTLYCADALMLCSNHTSPTARAAELAGITLNHFTRLKLGKRPLTAHP